MAKKYEELDFTDDFMFGKVLYHNPELCRELKEFLTYIRTGQASDNPESLTRRLQNCVIHARKHKEWRVEYMTLLMRDQEMREEGLKEGLKEGHNEINRLNMALIADNRLDDLKRSAADEPFQEQLLREYGIRKYESV